MSSHSNRPSQTILIVCLLQTILQTTDALRYLMMPMSSGSHVLRHGWVAKGLIDRGHEAYLIKHASLPVPMQLQDSKIKFIDYQTDEAVHFIQTENMTKVYLALEENKGRGVKALLNFFDKQCTDFLENEKLYEELKRLDFDFAVVDAFTTLQCFMAYPRRLGIPYAGLSLLPPMDKFTTTLQMNFITPTLPLLMPQYPDKPSLYHRLRQMFTITVMSLIADFRQNNALLKKFLNEKPLKKFSDLRNNVQLWLVDNHPIVDFAKPSVPNVVYVGGLTTGKVKPLPEKFQKFADSATNGLIVVSFGTVTAHLPAQDMNLILNTLNNITQKVILATPVDLDKTKIRSNVMVEKWIPQCDLLGHPNTKLLITHAGSSSQHQAIYYGVPMLAIPYQEEQKANAQRMEVKKFGRFINRVDLSTRTLHREIDYVLNDAEIRNAVKTASTIMKHRLVEPEMEAAFWVEHVSKHGGQHLVSYTERLAWYEILMLDIIVVIATVLALTTVAMVIAFVVLRKLWLTIRLKPKTE